MVLQGHFTASARRLRAEPRRPEADGDARTRFVLATEEPGPPRARRRASPVAIGKVADMQIELTLHPDGSQTDQTAADLDQTQADFDQAESEADQLASESDQRQAARDQNASDRDQVMADWEHAHAPAAALTDQAHQTSRMETRGGQSGVRFRGGARVPW